MKAIPLYRAKTKRRLKRFTKTFPHCCPRLAFCNHMYYTGRFSFHASNKKKCRKICDTGIVEKTRYQFSLKKERMKCNKMSIFFYITTKQHKFNLVHETNSIVRAFHYFNGSFDFITRRFFFPKKTVCRNKTNTKDRV